jgi:gamma-glutamyl hydrolase
MNRFVPVSLRCCAFAGIQTISVLIAGAPDVLESGIFTGVDPQMMALNLTEKAATSRLLGIATTPPKIRQLLGTERVTTNLHHDGVSPTTFITNKRLANFFDVLSTNIDTSGHPFVSTIEGKAKPVYATQWHPERPQFDWTRASNFANNYHSADAVVANSWMSRFFVDETRRNHRSFKTKAEEAAALIYNYAPEVSSGSYQAYLFSV